MCIRDSPTDDEAIAGRSSSIKLGIEVFELSQVSVASFWKSDLLSKDNALGVSSSHLRRFKNLRINKGFVFKNIFDWMVISGHRGDSLCSLQKMFKGKDSDLKQQGCLWWEILVLFIEFEWPSMKLRILKILRSENRGLKGLENRDSKIEKSSIKRGG